MIRKKEDLSIKINEGMRGGPGSVAVKALSSKEEMLDHVKLYAEIVLEPGCGIGYHEHIDEMEVIYVLEGNADYNDNGKEIKVNAGDVMVCPEGSGHSITNNSESPVKILGLVVLK